MAVRLACPACGAAFTPKTAAAGRVVPCARCGSDLQMPAVVAPQAAPVAKRPAPPPEPDDLEDRDERPARRPARAAAGASLLWLWVLLGSGAVGTFLGASVFYFAVREQPAEPGPVAQKPDPVPPPVEQPKIDPPKVDPPKVDPPEVDPPPVVPPKPKGPPGGFRPVPPRPPGEVAPDAIPGLKFYLAGDELPNGKVIDGVTRKPVGTAHGVEVVPGRYAGALRLTHDRKNPNRHALDLTADRDRLHIPVEKPFTLAFWARRVHADALSGYGAFLFDATTEHGAQHARRMYFQMLPSTPALAVGDFLDAFHVDQKLHKTASPSFRVPEPSAWNHYTLVREDNGVVRLLVNGALAPDARRFVFPGELRYDTVGLLYSPEGKITFDLDDFCLFDRALTDAELGSLTGFKFARPKEEVVAEVKPPAAGAVPAATEFKGLRFYLPCDAINDGALAEAVSGKNVGSGRKVQLVDGPRGKAVRATAGGPGGAREAFDLAAQAEALAIEEGKPFTLALWVRTDDWETFGSRFVDGHQLNKDRFRFFSVYRYAKGIGFLLQQGTPGGGANPQNQLARGTREMPPTKGWMHLALTRDEKGTVRLALDGEVAITAPGPFTADVRFGGFGLVFQQTGTFTADFDEFCLFDRVLSGDELARLAGRKPGAVVVVGPKDPPPPVGPKDRVLEIAPPPRVALVAAPLPVAPFPSVAGPKVPPPPEVAVSAPAGVDAKGLLLYLPFAETKDGTLREGTTGRFVGKCEGVELVKGPRGNAARLVAERADGTPGATRLDFGDLADRTAVPAGKPFTLALWMRVEPREPGTKVSGTAVQFGVRPDREYDRAVQFGFGTAGTLHVTARSTPDRLDPKRETAARWAGVANPAKWQHLAMVRDEKNVVRWYLNGKPVPQPGKGDPVWDGPLGFDRFVIGDPEQTKTVLELDELCLFDRVLTADEMKKLSELPK